MPLVFLENALKQTRITSNWFDVLKSTAFEEERRGAERERERERERYIYIYIYIERERERERDTER